jgi:hypothetical protein
MLVDACADAHHPSLDLFLNESLERMSVLSVELLLRILIKLNM